MLHKWVAAAWNSESPLILKYFLQSCIFHKTFPNNFQFLSSLCQTLSDTSLLAFIMGHHDSLFIPKSNKNVLIFRERLYCLSLHFSATENTYLRSVYGMKCWLSRYLLFDCMSYTYWGTFISGPSIWFWNSLWMVVIHASHCESPWCEEALGRWWGKTHLSGML